MTVIKRLKQIACAVPVSTNNSDTESLHLGSASASDTESINNDQTTVLTRGQASTLTIKLDEQLKLKKAAGKKKWRRYRNGCFLQTLVEEEDEDSGALIVIVEPHKSPLTRLLEDDNALQYWHDFVDKSEEEQNEIIGNYTKELQPEPKSTRDMEGKPSNRVSSRIKRTFKIKKNLCLEDVQTIEHDMIAFFADRPNEIYVRATQSYFERLLYYAIAQYHGLESVGALKDGRRVVEVQLIVDDWIPAKHFLTDYIAYLRR